ncbi:DNA/RNA non-specific endonuclease [Desmophyllum pertusum]|uniref:DNA/RNA non-specific endonuclease n=1 Tax=Desmophyllum pertusum TaxID=174260 RepID=A0A9W9ZN34_9CNID|nr:DNA/RNA non-specific endonuclease [Desmophyllum pertusum]
MRNLKTKMMNANNRSQQEGHGRMLPAQQPHIQYGAQCIVQFSVNGKPPSFPAGNTVAICQTGEVPESDTVPVDGKFATLFQTNLGIPRYSIYALDPVQVKAIGSVVRKDRWHQTEGIALQGSNKMYSNQPGPVKYQKGHVAPFNILSYSEESGLASFAYTNAVPQVSGYNMGQWKTYEGRIVKYAKEQCKPQAGTLYLITGISEISFSQASPTAPVQATRQVMSQTFPSHVPTIINKIAIPNSMWTVGCCVKAGPVVLGAFAVFGNNLPKNDVLMQANPGVTKAEQLIRDGANDQTIQLFRAMLVVMRLPSNMICELNCQSNDLAVNSAQKFIFHAAQFYR